LRYTLYFSKPEKYRIYIFLLSFVFVTFNPSGFHVRSLYKEIFHGYTIPPSRLDH